MSRGLYGLENYDAFIGTKYTGIRMKKVKCKLVIYTPINECYFYKVICNFKKCVFVECGITRPV